jgi:hypothetical protein
MNDPESAFRLISTELAQRRAPALRRASLEWDARLDVPTGGDDDCCATGDYHDAA